LDNSVIDEQIKGVSFKDARLGVRYKQSIIRMQTQDWSQSFPKLISRPYELKGFYRFINNTRINQSTFIKGYVKGLQSYSKDSSDQSSSWFLIHDTMYAEYNQRALDLGYTQTKDSNGMLLHHGLLLDHEHIPLGLLRQQIIHRDRKDFGKRSDCARKPIEEKESLKWLASIDTGRQFSEVTSRKLIHIMDREADITEVINVLLKIDSTFIIRARHDRSTLTLAQKDKESNLELFRLFHLIKESPHHKKIMRTLRSREGKVYHADCRIRYESFQFRGIDHPITCVHLQEIFPVDKSKKIEWCLLTNLSIKNFEQAADVVESYTKRWTIEDFHKCYKTGCSIEKRQFDSKESLSAIIGFLGLLAVQLLRGRYFAKSSPESSFKNIVVQQKAQELSKIVAKKYLTPTDLIVAKEETVLWWVLLMGRMGGHQGYKSKGLPGWQTLWKGISYFNSLLEGYSLIHAP
jgi:Transposase DNA-binding